MAKNPKLIRRRIIMRVAGVSNWEINQLIQCGMLHPVKVRPKSRMHFHVIEVEKVFNVKIFSVV